MGLRNKKCLVKLIIIQSILVSLGFLYLKIYSTPPTGLNFKFSDVKLHDYAGMLDDSENANSDRIEMVRESVYRDATKSDELANELGMNNADNVTRHSSNVIDDNGFFCQPKIPQISPILRPKIALASFMGSGNTWTRHLIQQMSGIGTSAVYCDRSLKLHGFPYECYRDAARMAVVKTHKIRNPNVFDRAVLLLRNPFDVFISATNWRYAGHIKHAKDEIIRKEVHKKFDYNIKIYKGMVRAFVEKFEGPVFILQYERLQIDLENTLTELAAFLELDVSSRDIECSIQLQNGNFHRPTDPEAREKLLHDIYDSEKETKIKQAMIEVEAIIQKRFFKKYKIIKSLHELFYKENEQRLKIERNLRIS